MSKPFKCRIGLHWWLPIHLSKGMSYCKRCYLVEDCYGMKFQYLKKDFVLTNDKEET